MSQACQIVSVAPVLLAVTQADVDRAAVSSRIRGMFDIVYSWKKSAGVQQVGHNHAVYDRCLNQRLRMQVGFPVSAPFADTELVKCVELAAGRAAHATHAGSYARMHVTYETLATWCREEALSLSGESWEVYGDWHDDPACLTTDIYLRLR